jgi:hypothetical protein
LKTGAKQNRCGKNESVSQPAPCAGNENRELQTGKSPTLNRLEKTKPRSTKSGAQAERTSGEAEGRTNKNSGNGAVEPSQRAQQLERPLGTQTAANTTNQKLIRSKRKMNNTLKKVKIDFY